MALTALCARTSVAEDWESVSLVRLLAEDQTLDGKTIRTTGFLDIGFERQILCLSLDDARDFVVSNCVFLYLEEEIGDELAKRFNGKLVVLQARCNVGPAEGFKVTLDEISLVMRHGKRDRMEIPEDHRARSFITGEAGANGG